MCIGRHQGSDPSPSKRRRKPHGFSRATLRKCHRGGGYTTEMCSLPGLGAACPKPRAGQGWLLLRSLGEAPVLPLSPRFADGCLLSLSLYTVSPLRICLSLCPNSQSHRIRAHPPILINLLAFVKAQSPRSSHSRSGSSGLPRTTGKDVIQSLTASTGDCEDICVPKAFQL